jgi:hypothetical protein
MTDVVKLARGCTEVPVLQGKLVIAKSQDSQAGRHSVGEGYIVVFGSVGSRGRDWRCGGSVAGGPTRHTYTT